MTPIFDFEKIKQSFMQELEKEQQKGEKGKFEAVNIDFDDFTDLIEIQAKIIMLQRGNNNDFSFKYNSANLAILEQLHHYLTKSDKFVGDFNRGILLLGSIGTGKTVIMKSFFAVLNSLCKIDYKQVSAKRLTEIYNEKEIGFFDKITLYIDDLGREGKEVTHYGTKTTPIIDILSQRYETGAWTFATSNFNSQTLKEFYGDAIIDRFKEMFNILILKGESLRK